MVAPRLLVIDDSLTIRRVLELALGGAGWRLEVAATGQAGITLARAAPLSPPCPAEIGRAHV